MNAIERFIARKEITNMLDRIFSHWKTTLGGVGVAVFAVVLNGRSTHSFAAAVAAALVGALAKDN